MKNPSRARSTPWLVLALVVACGALWLALDGSREDTRAIEPVASAVPPVAPIESNVARGESEVAVPESLAPEAESIAESSRAPAENAAVATTPLRAGSVVVQVSDPTRLGPLRWFNVRVASATRFAERRCDTVGGEIELPLTPDVYSLLVLSPGYEPAELSGVEVKSGEVVRLAPIVLRPGSGRIQVRVLGATDADRKLMVDLLGEGRHPCARCGTLDDLVAIERQARGETDAVTGSATSPLDRAWNRSSACPDCGFWRDRSTALLHPGGSFAFANLAGGSYALRLADTEGRTIDPPRQLTLDEGQSVSVVFDASTSRRLEIELFDVDGRSLTQEWSRRIVAAKSNVERVESVPDSDDSFDFVVVDEQVEWARATVLPPSLDGHRRVRPSAFGGRKLGTGVAKTLARGQPIDRPRRAGEALRPEVKAAYWAPVPVACEIGEHGFVTMSPLPATPLRLRVYAKHSEGEAFVPASRDTTRVRVDLHAR